jgi:hypothetical protein
MSCWKWQSFGLRFGKELELISHASSRKVNGLEFDRAPVEWIFGGMNEYVIDPADEVSAFSLINFDGFLWTEAVKEADLAEHNWFSSLEDFFANPAKDCVRLKEAKRTRRDNGPTSGDWSVADLLIKPKRTDATLLIAKGVNLERAGHPRERVSFVFDCGAAETFYWREHLKPDSVPFTDGVATAFARPFYFCHARCLAELAPLASNLSAGKRSCHIRHRNVNGMITRQWSLRNDSHERLHSDWPNLRAKISHQFLFTERDRLLVSAGAKSHEKNRGHC